MRPLVKSFMLVYLTLCAHLIDGFMVTDRLRAQLRKSQNNEDSILKPQAKTETNILIVNGDPLYLSPYITRGEIEEGQKKAIVEPFIYGIESFAGYITIDTELQSHLFFWLFKSLTGDWEKQPLIIWLQGGPGYSSLFGCFREIGPFYVDDNGVLQKREYPWNQKYNLLFIDQPVGTGYSHTSKDSGYANNEEDVVKGLYEFILQFYKLFPALFKNKLYIMGEDYAGKYIPEFSYFIYKKNEENKNNNGPTIPLAAIGLCNAFIDPYNMMKYGDFMFQNGMVDRTGRDTLYKYEDQVRELISSGQYREAERIWNDEVFGTIYNLTGLSSLFNYIDDKIRFDGPERDFLNFVETRRAIHAGPQHFEAFHQVVYDHLINDIMKSVKPTLEAILDAEAFDVVTFNGQLDIICAYPLSVNVYHHLNWKGAEKYATATRCMYVIGGEEVVGYYKNTGRFTEIMFRDCGILVPTDVPKVAFDFLDRMINNITSFGYCTDTFQ